MATSGGTEMGYHKRRRYGFMKKRVFFKREFPAILTASMIVIVVSAVYIHELNVVVKENNYATMKELASHDKMIIENNIEHMWEQLEYIKSIIIGYHGQTMERAQSILNFESMNGKFENLYLVAEDGKLYSESFVVYDPEKKGVNGRIDLLPLFEGEEEKVVAEYKDSSGFDAMKGERLLYGIRIEDFTIEGIKIVALAGLVRITNIQENMIVESYVADGTARGFSSVIDSNGTYIVNLDRTIYTNWESSMYQRLSHYQKLSRPIEEIADKISKDERFHLECVDEQGVRWQIYFTPFENEVNWYFMLSVEDEVFDEESRTFLFMSIFMLAIVMSVILLMILILIRSRNEALEANAEARARSEFLSTMSHEIRTPLNGVIGLLHLLDRDIDKGEAREIMKGRLAKAHDTATYLLALVSDILDMSKLQSGKVELLNRSISVEQIVDAVWSMQHDNIQNREISFVIEEDISVPWIIGDEVRIKQILLNIIGNSAKFTPAGGTISMKVFQQKEGDTHVATTFICSDTGCGMSPEFLEHIWESFSQERNKISDSIKGTGLGMAITKLLVDTMGAEITVESAINEGSVFTITFHSEISEEKERIRRVSRKLREEKVRGKIHKILVAEDNDLNAEIMNEILQEEGFLVTIAENGQEAVDKFNASEIGEFDLILMDMQMPVMDGCKAASEIRRLDREDAKSVYIFACTANTFQEDRERAMQSGMNDFLIKPIDADVLIQKIDEVISERDE